jgi:hypothetical protein
MKLFCLSMLSLVFATSSCRPMVIAVKAPELSDNWAVAESATTSDHYVLVKTQVDLEKALKHIGCSSKPCSIGRVGEVYVVTVSEPANQ